MKKTLLLTALICFSFTQAQIVNIPDANFKNALLNYDDPVIDTNNDNEIQISEAAAFTGLLDVVGMNISDLTGIEAFTALTGLDCNNNGLSTLDVSTNTALTYLSCYINNLSTLDVNTALTYLDCSSNNLSTLDVSTNTALTELYCGVNNLSALDVSTNTALTILSCRNNILSTLDVSTNTALTILGCSNNNLSTLDVSTNTALTDLWCGSNSLSTLDVSTNTALIELYCFDNILSTLDVSTNTALTILYCSYNNLSTLDVSTNTALTDLYCSDNQLANLNVKNGNNTNSNNFDSTNNPNLTCIFVDDATWSATNWTNIDATATFVETQTECDVLNILDETFKNNIELYPNPTLGILYIKNNENVTIKKIEVLNVLGQKLIEAQGVSNIDMSNLPNGIYYVNFESMKENKASYKIIKE